MVPTVTLKRGMALDGSILLEERIAEGGMGEIWTARHLELERVVAVKFIKTMVSDKHRAVERFLREARTVASLSHPHIIDLLHLGTLDDGRPYMVMPMLTGRSLEQCKKDLCPVPLPRLVSLLSGPASAIDALHDRNSMHRDLKPDNLFLEVADDGTETVILLDFGLARQLKGGTLTDDAGLVLGTPQYVPPDVAMAIGWTPRGDVYSFAVMAFELFTGSLPFDHPDAHSLLHLKILQDAPLASTLLDGVPPAVDEIFRQGMSRDPMERPASCGEFMEALRAVLRATAPGDAADPDHASVAADAGDPSDPTPTADVAPDAGAPAPPADTPADAPAPTPGRTKHKRKRKKHRRR